MSPSSTTVATPPRPMSEDDGLRAAGRSPKRYALKVRVCNESTPPGGVGVDPAPKKAPPPSAAAIATSSLPMLEVEVAGSDDGPVGREAAVIIHSTVPRGFAIVDNEAFEGKKIIATRDYARGDLLYVASCALLDLSPYGQRYELKIYSEEVENQEAGRRRLLDARVNTDTHSVDDGQAPVVGDGGTRLRQVYGWDSFMNHSCDANAHFPPLRRTRTESHYRAVAIRDIAAGDEVTCDYALFDCSCDGQEIEICACGAGKCRGKMLGFQALSLREKVDILHLCDPEVREKFLTTEGIKVFRSRLPDGIGIVTSEDGQEKYLVATHGFEVGDIIFENRIERIMRNCDLASEYLLVVDDMYHLLFTEEHFIHRTDYVEMIGFDCFMQHSCSPNAHQVYNDEENYIVYATKSILRGGVITCDYMALDNQAVGLESRVTITFKCTCGEKNCRGILRC